MKTYSKKALALLLSFVMIGLAAGCGKNTSAEESLQAEIDALRAQLETQGGSAETVSEETETPDETEVAEVPEETVEEVVETEEEIVYPFTITKERNNLALGDIVEYGDFFVGLAGVRMFNEYDSYLEGTWYDNYIPDIPAGQVGITPILQIYNASDEVLDYDDEIISLYVDNVQVTRLDPQYTDSYWVDGLEELIYTAIDPGEGSAVVSAFNVDENWSTLTIFYGDISWTVNRDEILSEPYVYTSMFNQGTPELTEPGTVVYRKNEYELVYDGAEVYSEGLRRPFVLFEFTVNNLTDSMLEIQVPTDIRAYCNHRLMDYASTSPEDAVNGHVNLSGDGFMSETIEIHPGMSSQIFISYPMVEESGTFTCYFETVDEGVVAVVSSAL